MTETVTAGVVLPSQRAVEAVLREMIERFGGVYGARDLASVAAALMRAERLAASEEGTSALRAAAAIGFTLSQSRMPTIAVRNRRAAWCAMFVTLRLNGFYLDARESDATAIVLGMADGSVSEEDLIAFLVANGRRLH